MQHVGILEMSLQIILLRLALSAWFSSHNFPHVRRITPLIPLHAMLPATWARLTSSTLFPGVKYILVAFT